ncbi:DUF2867 domain-containing protein [Vibrio sp. CAIM 722]|uniref:DUF2867 domain-containing protein n=1 Tax=Vibrio eleionomae TaxID=2653505 RepID=A0A7X4LMS2_9VIBR|nr:DUF2867 domain-containing protein [Vibrio eleionomae]MZI94799.1 DUF2867 domain-containing protein [Vibrio eleionomae]
MKRILVLGASGYVGSQLVPLLIEQGYRVTATARNVAFLHGRFHAHPRLTITELDLSDKHAVDNTIMDYNLVFFLVHGMAKGYDFLSYELSLAQNVRDALAKSQIEHVIYLSAIQPPSGSSEHIQARKETGNILRQSGVKVTELRAGVIIGPGSAAFEIMRDFVYNLPILIAPKWVDSRANPIALDDLNYYLLCLINHVPEENEIFEVGGPEVLSYREQFAIICKLANRPFRLWSTRLLTPKMASYWLSLVTSVPKNIGSALLDGLSHDYIADSRPIQERYPQPLTTYRDAVKATIEKEGLFMRSKVWGYDPTALTRWQSGFGFYPKQAGATLTTSASTESLWEVIQTIGHPNVGYFFANILWRTREWLDLFVGAGRPVRRTPPGPELQVGDFIDSWKVIRCEKNAFLSLFFGMRAPGLGRLEFRIDNKEQQRSIDIRAWWHPKGFLGLLYWFAMMPAHLFIFRGMVKAIEKKALALDKAKSQR